jgi:hypothetical protein
MISFAPRIAARGLPSSIQRDEYHLDRLISSQAFLTVSQLVVLVLFLALLCWRQRAHAGDTDMVAPGSRELPSRRSYPRTSFRSRCAVGYGRTSTAKYRWGCTRRTRWEAVAWRWRWRYVLVVVAAFALQMEVRHSAGSHSVGGDCVVEIGRRPQCYRLPCWE